MKLETRSSTDREVELEVRPSDSFRGLPEDVLAQTSDEMIEKLNHLLANEFTTFTKTLNYHWNVKGPRFHSLHEFFGSQYEELLKIMDSVAERVRILGFNPTSTLREFKAENSIMETPGRFLNADKMINDLLISHLEIQRQIQEIVMMNRLDKGTEDFLTGVLQQHQSMSWMLKSHLV